MKKKFVMFGDGYLQEDANLYVYSLNSDKVPYVSDQTLTRLKESESEYGHVLESYDLLNQGLMLNYQKKSMSLEPLGAFLNNKKNKMKTNDKKKLLALRVVQMIEAEYNNQFFVLPLPENILVEKECVPYFIYKATSEMPITGFSFNDCFIHTKRLVQYIYVYEKMDFSELLTAESLPTKDSELSAIASTQNFSSLKELLDFSEGQVVEQEIVDEVVSDVPEIEEGMLTEDIRNDKDELASVFEDIENNDDENEASQEDILKVLNSAKIKKRVESSLVDTQHSKEGQVSNPVFKKTTPTEAKVRAENPDKVHKEPRVESSVKPKVRTEIKISRKISLYSIILGSLLIVSLAVTTFLLIEKITYPSRVSDLKTELKTVNKELTKLTEDQDKLSKDNGGLAAEKKEIQKENEVLKEELENNVESLKKVLKQNESLKSELGKK